MSRRAKAVSVIDNARRPAYGVPHFSSIMPYAYNMLYYSVIMPCVLCYLL